MKKIVVNVILIIVFIVAMGFVLNYFSNDAKQEVNSNEENIISSEENNVDNNLNEENIILNEENNVDNNLNEESVAVNSNDNNNLSEENNMMEGNKVQIEILKEGEGVESKNGDSLTVHYVGTFENGGKFDSSIDRGEPFTFTLGSGMVIEGWEQGMLGMKKGEKRKLYIPYQLAYGENDYGPIPGKSNLIFEVELLDIK